MNTRTLKTWASVVLCGSMLAGCASLEERLASNDPATKREAEAELISQSRRSPKLEDRIAAIKRVTDESVLLSAAISARGPYVPDGEYVLTKLKGENNFVAVVNSAQDPRIRKTAFAKIDNQAVFEKLAVGASDSGIRAEAFKKLTSQDSILKVASQTSDTAIKIAAIDKVADKSKLLPIVFKKSTAPAMSKGDIQRAMMAIMRDRRTSDTEKKQKMAALNAMSNGGSASFDNAVVDTFIAKCTDKSLLHKIVSDYGVGLTADQCAKLMVADPRDEMLNAVAKIPSNNATVVAAKKKLEQRAQEEIKKKEQEEAAKYKDITIETFFGQKFGTIGRKGDKKNLLAEKPFRKLDSLSLFFGKCSGALYGVELTGSIPPAQINEEQIKEEVQKVREILEKKYGFVMRGNDWKPNGACNGVQCEYWFSNEHINVSLSGYYYFLAHNQRIELAVWNHDWEAKDRAMFEATEKKRLDAGNGGADQL